MTTLQDRFNINSQLEHLQVGRHIVTSIATACISTPFQAGVSTLQKVNRGFAQSAHKSYLMGNKR